MEMEKLHTGYTKKDNNHSFCFVVFFIHKFLYISQQNSHKTNGLDTYNNASHTTPLCGSICYQKTG